MALTAVTQDTTKLQPKDVRSIEFSDDTGDAAVMVKLTFLNGDAEFSVDAETFKSNMGPRQIKELPKFTGFIPDPMTTSVGTFVNDLVTQIICRVKVTYINGTTNVVDSGDADFPIMNFTKKWGVKDTAVGWIITGEGMKSVEAPA